VNDFEQRLKQAVMEIEARDPGLASELEQEVRPRARAAAERTADERRGRVANERLDDARESTAQNRRAQLVPETIVLRTGRPVLLVKNDQPDLVFKDAESAVWRDRLAKAKDHIHRAVLATGRIEVRHHPTFDWIGTGWLVEEDIIVTNRHVAQEFGRRQGTRIAFRPGTLGRPMKPSVDFLEEFGRLRDRSFAIKEVLHIEDDAGPDIALLKVERGRSQPLAQPIALSPHTPVARQQVATIGYPARDSRIPEQQLMEDIFGDVYDKKRLAPGQVIGVARGSLEHDCSTLGGNSGSVVVDLESGAAVGLHFAGRFLVANFAVPAGVIAERVQALTRASGRRTAAAASVNHPPEATTQAAGVQQSGQQVTLTIPLRITVDIGDAAYHAAHASAPSASEPSPQEPDEGEDDDEIIITEGRAEDYADRKGYSAGFLGNDFEVPLPEVVRNRDNVLTFQSAGKEESLLDYQHFSVMMGRDRKMCIFSAVNIDGKKPHKGKRPAWRTDPRIPESAQLVRGPYGNPPRFARGHMTRREDPMWGTSDTAARGNADSMHLTNAVPQMQPFNGGIWLALEDYALQNARQDDMRVSVFTGPVFRANDPRRFGVKIPVTFWKVIAFVHDDTGELSATGYTMSQRDFLREDEFVFGAHQTSQTSIAAIEQLTGLSFGRLAELDALAGEVTEAAPPPLTAFEQIRFVR
jgi:endonuclease G